MNTTPRERKERPAATALVLITVLLDTLGLGLLIPVGPRLVASFLGGDLTQASYYFGFLTSLYAAMQFLFSPVVGGLSDRFGRRPVILFSLLGAATSYLVSGFAPALGWLFVGRVISGATGASFSAAGAYIADITPPTKRAASFGLVGAAFGFGFILGPALGGLLGDLGLRVPYFVAAGLNFLNMMYGLFVLPESLPRSERRPFSFARANPLGSIRSLGRHPVVRRLTGTMMCSFMAQWILQSVWALYTQERYGWALHDVGLSLMVVGVATAIVQGFLVRTIVPRIGEQRALAAGLVMAIVGHLAIGLADRGFLLLLSIFPLALGGLAGPSVQALISREVPATEQGEMQGALNSLGGVAAIIGPLLGTALLAHFAHPGSTPYVPGAPFLAAAGFNALGLLLALRIIRRSAPNPAEKPDVMGAGDQNQPSSSARRING
jgi:DHA1 family tetracycline resistance protein-like MFS transporter